MSEVYTGEGLVTIKNPGNSKIEIEISGNEKQKTRSGKNIYGAGSKWFNNIGGTNLNVSERTDSSCVLTATGRGFTSFGSGQAGGSSEYRTEVEPNTEYTFSLKAELLSGSNGIGIYAFFSKDGSSEYFSEKHIDYADEITFVTPEDAKYFYFRIDIFNASASYRISEIQLEKGSKATEFEEYGAMPSFDYPSEVKTVGSNINEFDKDNVNTLNAYFSPAQTTIASNSTTKMFYVPCDKNTTYTVSKVSSKRFGIGFTDNIPTIGGKVNKAIENLNGVISLTRTSDETSKYLCVYYYKSDVDTLTEQEILNSIKVEEGRETTGYSPYNQGSIKLNIIKDNIYNVKDVKGTLGNVVVDEDDFITMTYDNASGASTYFTNYFTNKNNYLKTYTKYYGVLEIKSVSGTGSIFVLGQNAGAAQTDAWLENKFQNLANNTKKLFEFTTLKDFSGCSCMFRTYMQTTKGQSGSITFRISVFEKQPDLDTFVYQKHEEQSFVIPVQQKMFKQDKFDLLNKKEVHNVKNVVLDGTYPVWNLKTSLDGTVIQFGINLGFTAKENAFAVSNYFKEETNYNVANTFLISGSRTTAYLHIPRNSLTEVSTTALQNKLKELYDAGNPVTLWVEAETADELDLTPAQINILNQIENIELYEGINNITATSSIDPNLQVTVKKLVEDYNIYISEKGHLMIPEYNIDYLIDTNESNIPIMPEATESSVRAAGRDGDIVLNTTYEPIPFDIVCYTEDNLTQTEKLNAEKNINKFLNSIKNKTINIAFENNNTFYKVKYSGALVTTNYPKHLKFAIPLKSSDSYGKDLIQKSIVGNNTEESDTIEDVGALFIIRGPALNPIISLNDYSMEYTTSILEGASVEIDTSKSTITNVNNDGIRTNVMKYYNHQFPKIQNGINTLKILSGIDNDKNVIVTWNDLKL